jgi:hypothetical protein
MKQNQNEKGIDKNMDNMRRNPHRNNAMNPWGLGIGDWAQSPIPNPQSPIPNPHEMKIFL